MRTVMLPVRLSLSIAVLALSGLSLTGCVVFDPQRQLTIELLMKDHVQADDPQAVDVTTNPKNITDETCRESLPCVEAFSTAEANYLRFESKDAAAEYAATLDDGFVRNYIVMDFAGKDGASRDQQLWAMQNLAGTWDDYEGSFPDR